MAFVVFVLAVQVICTSAVKERFKPPQLTDEEENSNLLPAKMKCDGCRAAAYHMWVGYQDCLDDKHHVNCDDPISLDRFNAFEKLSLSNAKKLKEDVVYDAVDMGCDESNFREYGIKLFVLSKALIILLHWINHYELVCISILDVAAQQNESCLIVFCCAALLCVLLRCCLDFYTVLAMQS